ncbi:DUF2182 domain-containing protein [Actibacterium sp. MT2.3-13A]|uniref:DUF2182 domain-containing protein n=1 Tax=Actibacterium sp. MT2.3-13A TaxID=2828332 RepID=UPI001BA6CE13|nr:DUF2182 domain-containing protein [Actibacterium sp. MT2.3-13A]
MARQIVADGPGRLERLVRRDRAIVLLSVAVIVLIAGWYTVSGQGMSMSALDMTRMARPIGEPMTMGMAPAWSPGHAVLVFLMWWIMMIAMMAPSAAPTLLLFTALKRQTLDADRAPVYGLSFLAGYLACWAGFSLCAAALQWGLQPLGLISAAMMTVSSRGLAAALLVAAGLYQLTPLKAACLRHCRSPAHFLAEHRRPGLAGAFRMGARHGAYCLGCCWALMALLFVGGIMNLWWIAGIAAFVALEKLAPRGERFARVSGFALTGSGLLVALSLL